MATAKNAKIFIELSQIAFPKQECVTSDNQKFTVTDVEAFSSFSGKEIKIWVNGVKTGGEVTPDSVNDSVSVAALTATLNGEDVSVSTGTVAITRASIDTHIINSIIVNGSGALAAVQGSEGTSFSTVRGEAGGPALIPEDAIEIAQVKTSTSTSAAITVAQIEQIDGLSKESADNIYTVDTLTGSIDFNDPLPAIHTDSVTKKVYAQGFKPSYTPLRETRDFSIPEETVSNTTEEYYGLVKNNVSFGLGAGGFSTTMENGVDDPILRIAGENVHVKFQPSRFVEKYLIGQSIIGVTRNYPTSGDMTVNVTLNSQFKFVPYIP